MMEGSDLAVHSVADSIAVRSFCFLAGRSVAGALSGQPWHAIERFGDDLVDVMQLLRCDDVRGKNINHVAQRAKQHAFVEIKIVERRTQFREVTRIVRFEFQGHHGSNRAHVGNAGCAASAGARWLWIFSMTAMRSKTGSESKILRLATAAAQPSGFAV